MTAKIQKSSDLQFRELARGEDTSELSASEGLYVLRILGQGIPRRRIMDVCCSLGKRAIALAKSGFEVIGIDVSEENVAAARLRGAEVGVDVRWEVADLLAINPWPQVKVDAAIIFRPQFARNSKIDRRRLFRRLRSHLKSDGVLIVSCSPLSPALAFCTTTEVGDSLPQEGCFLLANSITRDLREAGFAVQRADADLTPGLSPTANSETIQIIARPLPVPPASLAVTSWRNPGNVSLDLRYAPDEAELLDPSPTHFWEELILSAPRAGADIIGNYPVDDPFGSDRGAKVVSRYFGLPIKPHQLTFGAGVTSLLHDLCGLADGGSITAPELVHGDLEAWAMTRGTEVRLLPEPATADELIAEVYENQPALLHLDRPTFTGHVISFEDLEQVVTKASEVGTVLLIDESAAPYLGPDGSAAQLVNKVHNLVVLRGFTKAYSLGGMRTGFAIASDSVAEHVRELVPPLQVSELSLRAALELLSAGDVFGRLRERIRMMKPLVIETLEAFGLVVIGRRDDLPWVAVSDPEGVASAILDERGICSLRPVTPRRLTESPSRFLRLTIPLSQERMTLFRRLLS